MAVQINEVIVRAVITGEESSKQASGGPAAEPADISAVTKDELLELIDEVIIAKKER